MKYCSKCGEQNPDEAKFCKKCGEPLSKMSFTQKEKYDSLQKERDNLTERCQNLIAFYNDRKQLYEQMREDDQYEAAIKDSRSIIEHNKAVRYELEEEGKRTFIIAAVICSIIGIAIIAFCCYYIWIDILHESFSFSNQSYDDIFATILWGTEVLGMGVIVSCIPAISLVVIENRYDKRIEKAWMPYENDITQKYLTPFIQKHEERYKMIGKSNNALLYEICEPEETTSVILQKIEEIDNRIKDLDQEMRLLTKV